MLEEIRVRNFAIIDHLELTFVGHSGQIRKVYSNRVPAFCLTPQTINPTRPLLNLARTPGQVVVDDMATSPVQVYTCLLYTSPSPRD